MSQIDRRRMLTGTATTAAVLLIGMRPVVAAAPLRQFAPRGSGGMDHFAFDALLAAHLRPDAEGYNRVDYRGFKAGGSDALKSYVATLEDARKSTFSVAEAHAYWINLYNAKTLDVVLDRYPVSSIKEINLGGGGPFGAGP